MAKKGMRKNGERQKKLGIDSQELKDRFLDGVNKDTEAFDKVMEAIRLPKKTAEDKEKRLKAIEDATKKATLVPLSVLKYSYKALELAKVGALCGNINAVSDAGVAALTAYAASEGAYYNVKINLGNIEDKDFNEKIEKEANKILKKIKELTREVRKIVLEKLSN